MPCGPAFLFPGEGVENVGMSGAFTGADRRRFDVWMRRAQAASGLPIGDAVFTGPTATLAAADVAQPALIATSLAVAESAHLIGLKPSFVAGHGLGEYTAAVVAGVLDPDDAMRLVAARGRLMAAAEREQSGAMGVVLGLPLTDVGFVCSSVRQ